MPTVRHVLSIGVNAYAAYDAAHNLPLGASDLHAPVNDVRGWLRVMRRVGVADGHIHACTTPALTRGQLSSGSVNLSQASTSLVSAAVDDIVQRLSRARGSHAFIVTFTGHGAFTAADGGQLFLADYTGTARAPEDGEVARDGVLYLERLKALVDARAPGTCFIALIDACRHPDDAAPTIAPDAASYTAWPASDDDVLLSACAQGQSSYERCFSGTWRGQLQWAVETIVDQWPVSSGGVASPYIEVSYADIAMRARLMIGAISAEDQPQDPVALGDASAAFLHVGPGTGRTQRDPDPTSSHQFPADAIGSFTAGGTLVTRVSAAVDGTTRVWSSSSSSPLPGVSSTSPMAGTLASGWTSWFSGQTQLSSDSAPPNNGTTYVGTFTPNGGSAVSAAVTVTDAGGGDYDLKWYIVGSTATPPTYFPSNGTFAGMVPNTTAPGLGTGQGWYSGTDNLTLTSS